VASTAVAVTIDYHRRRSTWARDLACAIALTGFAAERLVAGGIPKERIRIVPNFVSDPGPRLSPARDSNEVLYIGRLTREKGLPFLIDSWKALEDPELRLTIAGSGPLESLSRDASRSVSFLGQLSQRAIAERMLQARAVVVPSIWYEVQPLVILEALAAGLPVIASDIGAMPECVGAGGLVFPSGSSEDLVEALRALRSDDAVDGWSLAARLEFERRFDRRVALVNRQDLYSSFVGT
jgi:glycosyltransferase involved in cell wall biosynthesis